MAIDCTSFDDEETRLEYACALLITKRYVSRGRLLASGGAYLKDDNIDYAFIAERFEEISERLGRVGFELARDRSQNWICAVPKEGVAPRDRTLDKDASAFLIACGVLYERSLGNIGAMGILDADIQQLLEILVVEFGVFDQKPTASRISRSMARLAAANIVVKRAGAWEAEDVQFSIMPAIRAAVGKETIDAYREAYVSKREEDGGEGRDVTEEEDE